MSRHPTQQWTFQTLHQRDKHVQHMGTLICLTCLEGKAIVSRGRSQHPSVPAVPRLHQPQRAIDMFTTRPRRIARCSSVEFWGTWTPASIAGERATGAARPACSAASISCADTVFELPYCRRPMRKATEPVVRPPSALKATPPHEAVSSGEPMLQCSLHHLEHMRQYWPYSAMVRSAGPTCC